MSASTYGAGNRCQPLQSPHAKPYLLPHHCHCLLWALQTQTDPNGPEPSASDIIWILYILWLLNYLKTTLAEPCRGKAATFQLQHAFGYQRTASILFQTKLGYMTNAFEQRRYIYLILKDR